MGRITRVLATPTRGTPRTVRAVGQPDQPAQGSLGAIKCQLRGPSGRDHMGNVGGRTINIVEGDERAIDRQLSAAASAVKTPLLEVSQDLWADMVRSVPQLDGDETVVSLLAASVESNVATLLHLLEHGLTPESLDAPAAAEEYARRLAQREVPLTALVRAYRLGHGRFLGWCLDALRREVNDADVLETAARRLVDLSFRYIDRISELVISAYQEERDR